MKISSIEKYSFSGHGAGRIKALYMQNPNLPIQIPVYNELKSIGQAHNFDVFIHGQDELLNSSAMKYPSAKNCDYQTWSQDNKTILGKDGKQLVVSGLYMPETEQNAAHNLAKLLNCEHKDVELLLEGGNLFLGKKEDGQNYLIIGFKDVEISAMHFYLKSKLGEVSYDNMDEFTANLRLQKNGEIIASYDELNDDFRKWGDMVIERLQEVFDVKKENITILSQGQYHNDLVIRPLNYPYVLVNDEKMSKENLKKLARFYRFNINTHIFVKDMKNRVLKQEESYASCDELCEKLEKKGFVPIRIGGGYGLNTINFINAIVHQDGDDLIYITNSGISKNKNYIYLQALFEQDLKKVCPQISKVYFVKGAMTDKGSNIVLEYLKRHKGGIHCLCAEDMCE